MPFSAENVPRKRQHCARGAPLCPPTTETQGAEKGHHGPFLLSLTRKTALSPPFRGLSPPFRPRLPAFPPRKRALKIYFRPLPFHFHPLEIHFHPMEFHFHPTPRPTARPQAPVAACTPARRSAGANAARTRCSVFPMRRWAEEPRKPAPAGAEPAAARPPSAARNVPTETDKKEIFSLSLSNLCLTLPHPHRSDSSFPPRGSYK